jgi:hypothetical protein
MFYPFHKWFGVPESYPEHGDKNITVRYKVLAVVLLMIQVVWFVMLHQWVNIS